MTSIHGRFCKRSLIIRRLLVRSTGPSMKKYWLSVTIAVSLYGKRTPKNGTKWWLTLTLNCQWWRVSGLPAVKSLPLGHVPIPWSSGTIMLKLTAGLPLSRTISSRRLSFPWIFTQVPTSWLLGRLTAPLRSSVAISENTLMSSLSGQKSMIFLIADPSKKLIP